MGYIAWTSHHTIGRTVVHHLKAATLGGATREADELLGDGYRDHWINVASEYDPPWVIRAQRRIKNKRWRFVTPE